MRNDKGQFTNGIPPERRYPVGTIRVRTRKKRGWTQRKWIKIGEPNHWEEYSRYVWKLGHGCEIPSGYGIHHKDENPLNDDIENLELVSKKDHMDKHRYSFIDKCIASLKKIRREKKWSTKSKTKKNGRPLSYTEENLKLAIDSYLRGEGNKKTIAKSFGIPYRVMLRHTSF